MIVFSFDRDSTVDVNPIEPSQTVVPLKWIQYLAHDTDNVVWAHGNQQLKEEAVIPGKRELVAAYTERWGSPVDHVNDRQYKHMETVLETQRDSQPPDPDVITAAAEYLKRGDLHKHQILRLLQAIYPDAEKYVCVDNQYLGYVDGWEYHLPHEFVKAYDYLGADAEAAAVNMDAVRRSKLSTPTTKRRRSAALIRQLGRYAPQSVKEMVDITPNNRIPIRLRRKR
jgi:hypothetical protein